MKAHRLILIIWILNQINLVQAQSSLPDSCFIPFEENGKWGYYNRNKRIVINPIYEYASLFNNGYALVVKDSQSFTLNHKGVRVTSETLTKEGTSDEIVSAKKREEDNDWAYTKNGLWGCTNPRTGKTVIPFQYEEMYSFKNGQAIVRLDNKWGVVDTTGNKIYPIIYDFIAAVKNYNYYLIKNQDENSMLGDNEGNILLNYPRIKSVNEKNAIVITNDSMGVVEIKTNKIIIKQKYKSIYLDRKNDISLTDHQNKNGLANEKGEIFIPTKYKSIIYERYDLYLVEDFNGRKGYYSKGGISYFKD